MSDALQILTSHDWAVKCEDASRLHTAIPGSRYEKIADGGYLPHLERWRAHFAEAGPGEDK
jgi:hypothetical protein